MGPWPVKEGGLGAAKFMRTMRNDISNNESWEASDIFFRHRKQFLHRVIVSAAMYVLPNQ